MALVSSLARLATKTLAAAASRQIAERVSHGRLGPLGNGAAVALPFVLGRVSPVGLAAVAVGAWAVGKLTQGRAAEAPPPAAAMKPVAERAPVVTPPPIGWSAPADAY